MRTTQASEWLVAGVLALGLNGIYHDGEAQWVRQMAGVVAHRSAAVLALAWGRADEFLAEARTVKAQNETKSCRVASAVARIRTRVSRAHSAPQSKIQVEIMSARHGAELAMLEAEGARMEMEMAPVRFTTASFHTVDFDRVSTPVINPRIRVVVPKPRMMLNPVAVEVALPGTGPI